MEINSTICTHEMFQFHNLHNSFICEGLFISSDVLELVYKNLLKGKLFKCSRESSSNKDFGNHCRLMLLGYKETNLSYAEKSCHWLAHVCWQQVETRCKMKCFSVLLHCLCVSSAAFLTFHLFVS